jgi:hypothetical protein
MTIHGRPENASFLSPCANAWNCLLCKEWHLAGQYLRVKENPSKKKDERESQEKSSFYFERG